ncbi:MAG: efflux RND transporter periplasmic adaptor subunit [Alphaproteobacteria bacterium]|nr:efflux RND transporter periplasmic adaptor subunit [Alphaproteobacteria bacterium]
MIKRMILMIVAVLFIVGGMIGFKFMMAMQNKKFMATMPIPAQTVSSIKAEELEWQREVRAVGTLRAVNGADLASEVSGIVERVSFDSGNEVEQGSLLIKLRDEDDRAQLRALEAAAHLAQLTLDRDLKQLKGHAVSQATVDADTAALNSAKAQVDAQKAAIEKKMILAPFKGRLGIRRVDIGQFLNAGTAIVTLQQLDPIYVDFNVPEQTLAQLEAGQKLSVHVDALSGEAFDGEIVALNAKIDEATRNVLVRGQLKNPQNKLMPGMFAQISVIVGSPEKRITLPQTAITYNSYGSTVFVVGKDDKGTLVAKQTFVKLGPTRGDQVSILSGVSDGDEIVTTGQLKLRNGSPIVVNNEIQPKNDPNPKPEDK